MAQKAYFWDRQAENSAGVQGEFRQGLAAEGDKSSVVGPRTHLTENNFVPLHKTFHTEETEASEV
jgi:hypothetical protein